MRSLRPGLLVLAVLGTSCATTPVPPEDGDDEQAIVSSSVQLRKTQAGRVLELSRHAELGEVLRVLELMGRQRPRNLQLVVEGGPRATIVTGRRKPQSMHLAVGFGPDALLVFAASSRDLERGFLSAAMSAKVFIPLKGGVPDWATLVTAVRVAVDVAPQLRGLVVAAAPGSDAVLVVEAVQRLTEAAEFAEGATLIPW